ncbi:TATA box-binding protein-associated factor RNA polymerase I subunit B-like isoform X1 [Silene latifolia]|uniref:TATA box-binding protein-associated factor RNA polymerase I subunit B-like isoform X1 n=1 Tax=Silene latifolia TaxID=37657 RepID=UPI003D78471C
MTDTNGDELRCGVCDELGCYFSDEDGHFYCNNCNARVDDVVATGVADEDFVDKGGGGATYNPHYTRYTPSVKPELFDPEHLGPMEPADFGDVPKGVVFRMEDYYKSIRVRYVLGVQLLVEYQCEKLVEVFRVSPIICGIAGEVWLRFVASKRVFGDSWADGVIEESEIQGEKKSKVGNYAKHTNEPRNMYRKRMANIWCKSLKNTIPLSSSLAISYLACHIAREAVLPSDIMKWAIEGKLPYFGAFPKIKESIKQIERSYNCPSVVCPLEANNMFRPSQSVSLQKLESMAASIAHSIGLNLPPVNFHAIASGYLKQLCLPVSKILPYACRIEEWAMPPELWLSVYERRIPTRVCVMSILIVAIRILYNINGFGKWEMTLSNPNDDPSMDNTLGSDDDAEAMPTSQTMDVDQEGTSSSVHIFESDCAELLQNLQKNYDDLNNRYEYSKDLPTYLQYCKDVVFVGLEPLYKDPVLIDELWDFYQKNREGMEASGEVEPGLQGKRSRDGDKQFGTTKENPNNQANEPTISLSANSSQSSYNTFQDSQSHQTSSSADKFELSHNTRDMAIRHMKIDMEEQIFCYIPPRVKVKRHGYLHYSRKAAGDGAYTYIAHADYYILLRTCSKVAQVDPRVMHESVLSLERRLAWIEKRIDECVNCHKKQCETVTSDKISSSSFLVH